jgi:trehalose/maltose transport system substrate-binding protein
VCGAVGKAQQICEEGVAIWAQKTGNTVKVLQSPPTSAERIGLYQQQLAARSSDIDVYMIDVIWPGLLGQHFADLTGQIPQEAVNRQLPSAIAANTVNGKLIALPWFTDTGFLFYRSDLLEKYGFKAPPATWDELQSMAQTIMDGERKAGNETFQGFVFQGKASESLTCNALEWVASQGGGTIIDKDGEITVDNPKTVEALRTAAGWLKGIAPAGVTAYAEEDTRGIFQAGNAAFLRNWSYVWAASQSADSKVKDKVGVAPLPKGSDGQNVGTLGGWSLAVSNHSNHKKEATDLVAYLTGPEEQKRRAISGAFLPTIGAVYRDEEVLKANPFFKMAEAVVQGTVARPSAPTKGKYNQVSQAFSSAVHNVLTGSAEPGAAVKTLADNLERIKGQGW